MERRRAGVTKAFSGNRWENLDALDVLRDSVFKRKKYKLEGLMTIYENNQRTGGVIQSVTKQRYGNNPEVDYCLITACLKAFIPLKPHLLLKILIFSLLHYRITSHTYLICLWEHQMLWGVSEISSCYHIQTVISFSYDKIHKKEMPVLMSLCYWDL